MTIGESTSEVRAEFLAPAELDRAIAFCPVAYLPLGSLEFHGPHLPIGLDALTAHGVCVATAERTGGIVLPPIYSGTGGGHTEYPWTIMMSSAAVIRGLIDETLQGLERFGVRHTVLFTGHFADEQLALVDDVAASWNARSARRMRVTGTGVNRCDSATLAPDHAGVFETSLLHSLRPHLVHPELLPALAENPAIDPHGNPAGPQRHETTHPLWGVFGPDPRVADLAASANLRDSLVDWLGSLARVV